MAAVSSPCVEASGSFSGAPCWTPPSDPKQVWCYHGVCPVAFERELLDLVLSCDTCGSSVSHVFSPTAPYQEGATKFREFLVRTFLTPSQVRSVIPNIPNVGLTFPGEVLDFVVDQDFVRSYLQPASFPSPIPTFVPPPPPSPIRPGSPTPGEAYGARDV